MFCNRCGAELSDSAKFCKACGKAVGEPSGDVMHSGQNSYSAGSAASSAASLDPRASQHSRAASWVKAALACVLVLALACIAVGGFFAVKTFLPAFAGYVFVNDKAFPDEGMREAVSTLVDSDGDGIISPGEAEAVKGIVVSSSSLCLLDEQGAASFDRAVPIDAVGTKNEAGTDEGSPVLGGGITATPPQPIGSIAGIDLFPSVRTLVCRGMGLSGLDLSKMPAVQFVDCRENSITSLDLSGNGAILSLFCDDDVEITGMENAGLYEECLMTGISRNGSSASSGPMAQLMGYDWAGRPTSISTDWLGAMEKTVQTYRYDSENGNLISSESAQGSEEPVVRSYSYDDAGMLVAEQCETSTYSDEVRYAYDEKGRLVAEETAQSGLGGGGPFQRTQSYEYDEGGKLSGSSLEYGGYAEGKTTASLFYDEDGRLMESERASASDSSSTALQSWDTTSYFYGIGGLCTRIDTVSSGGAYGVSSDETVYDETGRPVSSKFSEPYGGDLTVSYETNAAGYVTHAQWSSSEAGDSDYRDGAQLTLAYMKHVAPILSELDAERAPRFVFVSATGLDNTSLWGEGNGVGYRYAVAELGMVDQLKIRSGIVRGTIGDPAYRAAELAQGSPDGELVAGVLHYENRYFSIDMPPEWANACEITQLTSGLASGKTATWLRVGYGDCNLVDIGASSDRSQLGNAGMNMVALFPDTQTDVGCIVGAYWDYGWKHDGDTSPSYFETLSASDQEAIIKLYEGLPELQASIEIRGAAL